MNSKIGIMTGCHERILKCQVVIFFGKTNGGKAITNKL